MFIPPKRRAEIRNMCEWVHGGYSGRDHVREVIDMVAATRPTEQRFVLRVWNRHYADLHQERAQFWAGQVVPQLSLFGPRATWDPDEELAAAEAELKRLDQLLELAPTEEMRQRICTIHALQRQLVKALAGQYDELLGAV